MNPSFVFPEAIYRFRVLWHWKAFSGMAEIGRSPPEAEGSMFRPST